MKALIKVGYGCNENCTFCHTLEVRHIDGSAAEVHAKIDRAARLGHTMVVLSGGEPTIRPELYDWAEHVARLGLDLGLVTNGLVLAYPDVVARLVSHRLKYVYMSLHGGRPEVHQRLVRARTFDTALTALGNLHGRGLDLTVNCVVTNQNVDDLDELVDLLRPFPDLTLKFSMLQPKGGGDRAFAAIMPRVAHVAERVRAAIAHGRALGPGGPRLAHDGIPLCLLEGAESLYDDLKTHAFATMVDIGEPDFFPVDDRDKIQPPPCAGCALSGPCPGLYRGYHEAFGHDELRPVTRAQPASNSFHWIFETLVPSAPDRCPLVDDGVTPWDRARHLFVRHQGKIGRFRTGTRDFSDAALGAIKHERGQVYFDVSKKSAADDFPRDLVKLTRSGLCDGCVERPRCTGLWEPLLEDVFTRDDARVRAILGDLAGDVLDVGCGDGPYDEVLAPLVAAARLRYLGIDPDAARLDRLRARRGWGEHLALAADAVSDEARFDHVLVLRSWNHLPDPARALDRLVRALRPGGALWLVDNVAFGLARTRAQAERAERGPAAFEHFRNDGATEAIAWAAAQPLRLVEQREVGPATSNQWLAGFVRL